jgi:aspartyl-tRNA(Asn)/glutamyl-tRNA(Gln) amidotransferase subunit A
MVPEIMRVTGPVGYCGLASASIPAGFGSDGMPIGVQLISRDESTALSAATRLEASTNHHSARPPIDKIVSTNLSSV